MNTKPTFYLTTAGESEKLADPRACWAINRLKDPNRDDHMLVKIDPPLVGQSFGLGSKDIDLLLLATKLQGETLFPIQKWPVGVYVARILDESILEKLVFNARQVELVAWGTLFPTFDEAYAVAKTKF